MNFLRGYHVYKTDSYVSAEVLLLQEDLNPFLIKKEKLNIN